MRQGDHSGHNDTQGTDSTCGRVITAADVTAVEAVAKAAGPMVDSKLKARVKGTVRVRLRVPTAVSRKYTRLSAGPNNTITHAICIMKRTIPWRQLGS